MRITLFLIALIAVSAHATIGGNRNASNHHNNTSSSSSSAHVETTNRVESVVSTSQETTNVAQGGSATSTGGTGGTASATGGSGGKGGSVSSSISNEYERSAPSIGLVAPQSTMECAKGIGLGGSNTDGSVLIGWTWLQRDCWAMKQFETLAAMRLPVAAARAYCSRRMHWFMFESQEDCQAQVAQSLILVETDRSEVAEVKKLLPSTSPLQRWMKSSSLK